MDQAILTNAKTGNIKCAAVMVTAFEQCEALIMACLSVLLSRLQA